MSNIVFRDNSTHTSDNIIPLFELGSFLKTKLVLKGPCVKTTHFSFSFPMQE